jgi:OmpA-OmpF porin, OOP family
VRTGKAHNGYLVAGAVVMVAATAGCGAVLATPVNDSPPGPVRVTEHVPPALLVVVVGPDGAGPLVRQVVTETARPREDLNVVETSRRGRVPIASVSPSPATVLSPGRPAPGTGTSSFQQAHYQKALGRWRGEMRAAEHTVAIRTRTATAAWARRLSLKATDTGSAADLPQECSLAASAVSGLIDQAGDRFGPRRVVLLSVSRLDGMPPAGQLGGDDVIVTTGYLPSSSTAAAAQANLLAAGADRATVLGPEATAGQVGQLVSEGLSARVVTETLSAKALFANDSSVLLPSAVRVLGPLVGPLRRPGATGVINGYASVTGTTRHNLWLSQQRAIAVARFLEARGVPEQDLFPVGHGASDLIARGSSGDNRRVVVVIEEP